MHRGGARKPRTHAVPALPSCSASQALQAQANDVQSGVTHGHASPPPATDGRQPTKPSARHELAARRTPANGCFVRHVAVVQVVAWLRADMALRADSALRTDIALRTDVCSPTERWAEWVNEFCRRGVFHA